MEIVIIAGPPASGKFSAVQPLLDTHYLRINRDELGGTLKLGGLAYQEMLKAFDLGIRNMVRLKWTTSGIGMPENVF